MLTKLADFDYSIVYYPQGSLVQGSDGDFYGLTQYGGDNGHGTAFKVTAAGVLTKLADFNSSTTGYQPKGSLVQGSDGDFYGLAYGGGVNGAGTVFKLTAGGVLTKLADFDYTNGYSPQGSLVQGSDGDFYGLAQDGGNGSGTAFKVTAAGVLTKLADFNYSTTGQSPHGDLVQGSDGDFYGLTQYGGVNGAGAAFKLTAAGVLTKLADFAYSTNGYYPLGSLVQGSDGAFYGLTQYGGVNGHGTAFTIDAGIYTYPGPRISVAGVDDGGAVSYGTIATGTNSDRVFTIKNKGNSPLTGLNVSVEGANASNFTVIADPVAPIITPGGTTTFTVRFSSTTSDDFTANLHITSNDVDRNPYDITLRATALPLNWQPQVAQDQFYHTLHNVTFVDTMTGWAVGYSGLIRKTTDGGVTWTQLASGGESLYGVSFVDANTGWVSGTYGALMKTTNGGATWTTQTSSTGAHCWGVYALNSTTAWQAGSSGMLGRTTDGVNWTGGEGLPFGNSDYWGMYDIEFADANNGWAVAGGSWSARTTDGGVSWTRMNTVTEEQLLKLDFVNATTGWAVGNNGTIIKTTDGGVTWAIQNSGTSEGLNGVSFVDNNTGWAVGNNGTILHTTNGGTTWEVEFSNTTAYLSDVDFVDSEHGWIVGENGIMLTYAPAGGPTNSAPTDIALSANSIDENNAPGATIGTLSAIDPNVADTHTFTFAGGADDGAFTITGDTLSINDSADFEAKSSYSIRIRATDSGAGNLTFEKNFTVTINDVLEPSGPLAVNDAVTTTTGETRIYPLANDGDPNVTILSVSDGNIIIDGRSLIIPEGFTGTFTYTTSRGRTASVAVSAGAVVTGAKQWAGLLYDGDGAVVGRVGVAGAINNQGTSSIKFGSATVGAKLLKVGNGVSVSTSLGGIVIRSNGMDRLDATLTNGGSMFTARLRPVNAMAPRGLFYHIALAGSERQIVPGGGIARVLTGASGTMSITCTLPDAKTVSFSSMLTDNGSFSFYGTVSGTNPQAVIAGECQMADLAKTDVTGEVLWLKAVQSPATGLHKGGVDTVLTANGSEYKYNTVKNGNVGLQTGNITVRIGGGDLVSDISQGGTANASVFKPNGTPLWGSAASASASFVWNSGKADDGWVATLRLPGRTVKGRGYYMPKSNSVWGTFPGTTVGGYFQITQP